ncbi:MAG: metallophosphoesterase [Acidobacteria bacterium]|nr:metallophosphoesterase [Acidobacteriota bacterium]
MQTLNTVSRRAFLKSASSFSLPLFSIEFQTPRFITNREIEVTRHSVGLRNLPPAFDGFRVVHLSDIHHSKYVSFNAVYRMVALANRQRADLVFLTGDYVTWSKKYITPMAEALRDLKARHGVFGVLGNHDTRVDGDAVTRALRKVGIQVLRNASARVDYRGQSLWLSGVDEYSYGQSDVAKALHGLPSTAPRILLAHNPEIIALATEYQVDFVAAGHTHGGQVKLPGLKSLNSITQPNQEFLEGFVSAGRTQMYISRGLGKVVVPLRIKCPAEIPVYTLRSSSARIGL